MIVWLDAQLPPALAKWMRAECSVQAIAIRDLKLRDATDEHIFSAAREAGVVLMTKDSDFVTLFERHGVPPQVIWITMGNCSNEMLRTVLKEHWSTIERLLKQGEALVEVSG